MKLKFLLCLLLSGLLMFSSFAQNSTSTGKDFAIEGRTTLKIEEAKLVRYEKGIKIHLDSTILENGNFRFVGQINAPEIYYVEIDENFSFPIFMEPALVEVKIEGLSIDSVSIVGSGIHEKWIEVKRDIQKFDYELGEIREAYYKAKSEGDEKLKNKHSDRYDDTELAKDSFIDEFILNNSASYISPYLTVKYLNEND